MALSLRAKLLAIVGVTALSLAVVIAIGVQLALQQQRALEDLEQRVLPKLELEPRLAAQFAQLGQDMRDAVAAQDKLALEATRGRVDLMSGLIEQARGALAPAAMAQLRAEIAAYHEAAYRVSLRMINGERGESLLAAMEAMQAQHRAVMNAIERLTKFDRRDVEAGLEAFKARGDAAGRYGLSIALASLALVIGLSLWLGRGALSSLEQIGSGISRFAQGQFSQPIAVASKDELGQLAEQANRMAAALDELRQRRDASEWVRIGQVELGAALRLDLEPLAAARAALEFVARRVDAVAGALYLRQGEGRLRLAASYAGAGREELREQSGGVPGENLVSEVARARELRVVAPVPAGYLEVRTGLGSAQLQSLVLLPLLRGEHAIGVLELGFFSDCKGEIREFLSSISESLAVALESAQARARQRDLLEESQTLASRLSAQEEELTANNRELSVQQEELRQANDELEVQRSELRLQNQRLEEAQARLQEKANELLRVSAYKSQFLANMSHELRTPLNSMLLLSNLLGENESGNLTARQVEHCRTIYSAGRGLLSLINQILDLSKIEAGKQELDSRSVVVAELAEQMRMTFEPQFAAKGLFFRVEVADELPESIVTDPDYLVRILINLLGNALKFTERGGVTFSVSRPRPGSGGDDRRASVAFSVTDTGVGIPAAHLERIFGRFEQADARTARRYGGTGLGLAIARESALLLGGQLLVESVEGEGSTFVCVIPERLPESGVLTAPATEPAPQSSALGAEVPDDRFRLEAQEPYLLLVEDDPIFANHLLEIVHSLGLKGLHAGSGEEALRLARARPPAAVVLDVTLPDTDGHAVRAELAKHAPTASVPVHFVSAASAPHGLGGPGVVGYLTKPATREALVDAITSLSQPLLTGSRVLIVEDDIDTSESLAQLLAQSRLETREVRTAQHALRALSEERFDCVILDLGLPDTDGLGLLEELQDRADLSLPPIVVHTARALSRDEARRLRGYADAVVLKDGRSVERLIDEVRLFVGKVRDKLPHAAGRGTAAQPIAASTREVSLDGTKILIADDDMRTVYALSALLRGKGAEVVVAETGREALRRLHEEPGVHLVLMDIMMPDMDGYEAMRELRTEAQFASLPVVALTAKAMRGERERCVEAGANDYLAKPVDPRVLLQTLSCWLQPEARA